MKPKTIRQDQGLLFQSRLSHLLNPEHELLKLSKAIPWDLLEAEFASLYSNGPGQPPIPIRLAAGLMILQHMFNVSDERVVEYWGVHWINFHQFKIISSNGWCAWTCFFQKRAVFPIISS